MPGFNEGVETVVVSDTDLPDLVVSTLTALASAIPHQRVSITYRVANQGLSVSSGSFLTRVYLSRDATVGDDVLVAQFRSTSSLVVSNHLERTEQIQLPLEVGNYWVVVETDAEQSLAEVLEDNNTRISATPIAVSADYAAWVQTDITNAPAGTSVPLYGRATNSLGAGAGGRPVSIHLKVRGTERVLGATTDGAGNFTLIFTPLPNEAGRYDIFATHPGVKDAPIQDSFKLLGFRAVPATTSVTIIESTTRTGSVNLENLSDVPLTGLSVQVVSKPAGLTVAADVSPLTLPGSGASTLNYIFTATTTDAYGTVVLRVGTAEGVSQDIYFGVSVEPLRPRLVAAPNSLNTAMPVGGQTVVEFEVTNLGGRETGPISISLPAVPWMHIASTNPMPSLTPGQANRVTLLLTPATNVDLGPHTIPLGGKQVNIKITNHGLIAARGVRLGLPTHPLFTIVSSVGGAGSDAGGDIGALPPGGSIEVPVGITPKLPPDGIPPSQLGPCHVTANVCWQLLCGPRTNIYCSVVAMPNARPDCGVVGPAPTPGAGGCLGCGSVGDGGGSATYTPPASLATINLCDRSRLAGYCLPGERSFDLEGLAKRIVTDIQKRIPAGIKVTASLSASLSGQLCTCCIDGQLGLSGEAQGDGTITLVAEGGFHPSIPSELTQGLTIPGWKDVSINGDMFVGITGGAVTSSSSLSHSDGSVP